MFSCLGRIGCLFLLLIVGAIAFLKRDDWMPRVLGRGERPPTSRGITARVNGNCQ